MEAPVTRVNAGLLAPPLLTSMPIRTGRFRIESMIPLPPSRKPHTGEIA
jgi:hypothetical protein